MDKHVDQKKKQKAQASQVWGRSRLLGLTVNSSGYTRGVSSCLHAALRARRPLQGGRPSLTSPDQGWRGLRAPGPVPPMVLPV